MNDSNVWSQGISSLALPEVLSFCFGGMFDNTILAMPCKTHGICSVLQGTKWYCKEFCQGNIRKDPRVIARAVNELCDCYMADHRGQEFPAWCAWWVFPTSRRSGRNPAEYEVWPVEFLRLIWSKAHQWFYQCEFISLRIPRIVEASLPFIVDVARGEVRPHPSWSFGLQTVCLISSLARIKELALEISGNYSTTVQVAFGPRSDISSWRLVWPCQVRW